MPRTRIKICGIRDLETALAAAEAGADAIGFVFHPQSPRFIAPDDAFDIALELPPLVATVGLFVNCPLEKFSDMEEACPTTLTQLHGAEPVELVKECGPGVIKAVKFDPATIVAELRRWNALAEVDAILVDGSAGGEGRTLDWGTLRAAMDEVDESGGEEGPGLKPVFLAGGLTPGNVADAISIVRPWAVDVSSGVESAPGVKDPDLIEAFCAAVQSA